MRRSLGYVRRSVSFPTSAYCKNIFNPIGSHHVTFFPTSPHRGCNFSTTTTAAPPTDQTTSSPPSLRSADKRDIASSDARNPATFEELGISSHFVKRLAAMGITTPSEVQTRVH